MSIDDLITAEARVAAINHDSAFYKAPSIARALDAASSPLRYLQDSIARIQDQIRPFDALTNTLVQNAMRETTLHNQMHQAAQGIADLMCQANPMHEIERGIAEAMRQSNRLKEAEEGLADIIRRADPTPGLREALRAAQQDNETRIAAASIRFQQPLIDLEQSFRLLREQTVTAYTDQVSSIHNAIRNISGIFDYARHVVDEDPNDRGDDSTVSGEAVGDILANAFPISEGTIDALAFERGVETILRAIRETKDSRVQKLLGLYLFPFVLFLLTVLLQLSSQKSKESSASQDREMQSVATPQPSPAITPAGETQKFAEVTAVVLNVRRSHSRQADIIAQLKSGERVTMVQTRGAWTEVVGSETVSNNSIRGWVATKYLKREMER